MRPVSFATYSHANAYVAKVKQALEQRLKRPGLDSKTVGRINDLLELTRPVMVAECWGRTGLNRKVRLIGAQYLVVGVPDLGPGAQRPSHFDRIDDRVAHCVSGQSLSPGEHPVGIAIPHPRAVTSLFFRLVNLTSPRRQMAYLCEWQLDDARPLSKLTGQNVWRTAEATEAKRLSELSRRTFDWLLARRRSLSLPELHMIRQLDATELSRFAGVYFTTVNDRPVSARILDELPGVPLLPGGDPLDAIGSGQPSQHGMICEILAAEGTREAADGLVRALGSNRFLPPTAQAPYRFPWIAALAIANRDPWPEVDAWLATLMGRTEPLVENRVGGPDLGGTAAALLLRATGNLSTDSAYASYPTPSLPRWI